MDLNTAWFLLMWILFVGYAVLDGFDLGVGVLHLVIRGENERRICKNAIAPFWDGNEVWLLTGGGALFAAFPVVYATVFSGFYLAIMLLLFALIFRAVALEFHGQIQSQGWRKLWDNAFGIGSLVPALLFGTALGNVLRSLPITNEGMLNISFVSLLNPYSLLIGIVTLVMFTMHGAAFLAVKTEGALQQRATRCIEIFWTLFVALYTAASIVTFFVSPFLFEDLPSRPAFWLFLPLMLAALVSIPIASRAGRYRLTFLASAVSMTSMIGLTAISLFPRLAPSSIDLGNSLTIYNAASTPHTLTIMLIIALIGMPFMLSYTAYIYMIFRGKVALPGKGY